MKRASDGSTVVPNKILKPRSIEKTSLNTDPIHVYCRLRPLRENSTSCCATLLSENILSLTAESKLQQKNYNYIFKRIFSSYANQAEIFTFVALPLLEDLINGKNGLLFTYGITGSGKTFTLTGNQANPGIMPQCIDTLFNTIGDYQTKKFLVKPDKMNGFEVQSEREALEERSLDAKSLRNIKSLKTKSCGDGAYLYTNNGMKLANFIESNKFAVFITYVEIYNNTVFDLLDESSVLQTKIIRKDSTNNMYVNGVVEKEVKSSAEAFELFTLGQRRKRMAQTTLNTESSRSHSIFNIRLIQIQQLVKNDRGQLSDQNLLRISQLSLVDLAGSERCNRTKNTGMRLKEASSINNSLMKLRACLEILRENQLTGSNKLVPYRDSRLTLLFKNYFEGEGQVSMIVCVNSSIEDYEENLQVLRFAEITQEVKVPRSEAKYIPCKTPKASKCTQLTPGSIKSVKKSYSFGPKIPDFKFSFENIKENETNLNNLIKILQTRKQKKEVYDKDRLETESCFRKHLLHINKTNTQNIKTIAKKQNNIKNSKSRISDLEKHNSDLISKNNNSQETILILQNGIKETNIEINQTLATCGVRKERFTLENAQLLKVYEENLNHCEGHEAELQCKDAKLQEAKTLLNNDELVFTSAPINASYHYDPQQTPTLYRRNRQKPLQHRRSRSAGDVWLEHNTVKPAPLSTVFQPTINKRKSLTHLNKASDVVNSKQNRYCLIAQETHSDGQVETKLYKGDILPTYGGGAKVIFNEVEKLQ